MSYRSNRHPTQLTRPPNCSLLVSKQPSNVILRGPSKCRAHRKKNNLNFLKNRKNTYQHILIKNLETKSGENVCTQRTFSLRERKMPKRKNCVHVCFGSENKLHTIYPSYRSLALLRLALLGRCSVVFIMLFFQLKQFLLLMFLMLYCLRSWLIRSNILQGQKMTC